MVEMLRSVPRMAIPESKMGGLRIPSLKVRRIYFLMPLLVLFSFDGLGVDIGITIRVPQFATLVAFFGLLCYLNPAKHETRDVPFLVLVLLMAVSLLRSFVLKDPILTAFGGGPRGSATRGLMHICSFSFLFLLYRVLKAYLSSGDCGRKFQAMFKGLWLGVAISSAYATYQIFAMLLGWPFTNLNNIHKVGAPPAFRAGLPRIFGFSSEPRTYASYLLLLLPLLAAQLLISSRSNRTKRSAFIGPVRHRRAKILLVFLLVVHLVLTTARGALLVAVVGLIAWVMLSRSKRVLIAVFLGFIVTGLAVYFLSGQSLWTYGQTLIELQDISALQKHILFRTFSWAVDIANERPLLGLGPGGFASYVAYHGLRGTPRAIQGPTSVVNYLMANSGWLGLLVFVLFFLGHALDALRLLRRRTLRGDLRHLLLASFLSCLMTFLVLMALASIHDLDFWVALAIMNALIRIGKNQCSASSKEMAAHG